MKKRALLIVLLISLVTLLTGCTEFNEPITSESTGIWNQYFVYPLSLLITKVAKIAWGSYGLSIVFVTILIRLLILPLMVKQMKSSRAMQVLQPEMKKLQEKYSSKDQKTQQKLQQETMALFQKHGVNPFAGCLPLFVQMPILMGFYHAINRTPEIKTQMFLWFELGANDPFYILPLVAGATTFIQQKVMMAGTDASQNPQMAMMLWMMPIMIIIFAIKLPAALPLYWIVGNIFMIIQTYFIKTPELDIQTTNKVRGKK